MTQGELKKTSKGSPKPSCESIVNIGKNKVEVISGVLRGDALAVFSGYKFIDSSNSSC